MVIQYTGGRTANLRHSNDGTGIHTEFAVRPSLFRHLNSSSSTCIISFQSFRCLNPLSIRLEILPIAISLSQETIVYGCSILCLENLGLIYQSICFQYRWWRRHPTSASLTYGALRKIALKSHAEKELSWLATTSKTRCTTYAIHPKSE